jgi:hypothetical protein
MNEEPNAVCPSVPHWQAWHEVHLADVSREMAREMRLRTLEGAMRSCNIIVFSASTLNVGVAGALSAEDAYKKGYETGAVACRERIRARKDRA